MGGGGGGGNHLGNYSTCEAMGQADKEHRNSAQLIPPHYFYSIPPQYATVTIETIKFCTVHERIKNKSCKWSRSLLPSIWSMLPTDKTWPFKVVPCTYSATDQ